MSEPAAGTPGQYLEPGYAPRNTFMSDEAYSLMLDSIVVTCVDVAVVCGGNLLLGKRAWHPQADWWLIGGRMRAGETFEQAAVRNLVRETGLTVASSCFTYLTMFSAAWKLRRHAPAEHGTHTLSVVMMVAVDESTASGIRLNEEYSASRWVGFAEVAADRSHHGALRQCAKTLISRA